jgi:hypothetical protein
MASSRVTSSRGTEGREVIRLAPPVVLWWVWVAFVALNVIDYAVQGLPSARFGSVVSAILLLVTGLAYVLALRPRVVLDGSGLMVLNPFRSHHVPWRRVTCVDTGEWVRVHLGDGRKVECWALYVSGRAKRKIARRSAGSGDGASSRMPDEAKYLSSLPVAKAMAIRLDSRARRERARKPPSTAPPAPSAAPAPTTTPVLPTTSAPDVMAKWSWPSIAVAVIPALILVIVVLT